MQEAERAAGVEAVCRLSGRRVRVRARCVINAAGPWVEAVRRLESPAAPPLLHLSKGVHIVVTAERLPVRNLLLPEHAGPPLDLRDPPRPVRGDRHHRHELDAGGADVWPEITREDVEYLLEPPGRYLRGEKLAAGDVIGAWAGLRPLIAQPGKKPSEISRRDEVLVGPAGVVTMAGGKLTGYRPLARETVERAAEVASLRLAPAAGEDPPLPGGDFDGDLAALEAALVRETGVGAVAAARLARLHGSEAASWRAAGPRSWCPACSRARSSSPSARRAPPRSRTCSTGGCGRRSTRGARARPRCRPRPSAWRACSAGMPRACRPRCAACARSSRRTWPFAKLRPPASRARGGLDMSKRRDALGGGRLVGIVALAAARDVGADPRAGRNRRGRACAC